MNIYIINEHGLPHFHKQLWINGYVHRSIGSDPSGRLLEKLDLALKEDNDFDSEDVEERSRYGNWDQKLKWSPIL